MLRNMQLMGFVCWIFFTILAFKLWGEEQRPQRRFLKKSSQYLPHCADSVYSAFLVMSYFYRVWH